MSPAPHAAQIERAAQRIAEKYCAPKYSDGDWAIPDIIAIIAAELSAQPSAEASDVAALRAEVERLRAELLTSYGEGEEQARLLGAGGSREAALMSERDQVRSTLTRIAALTAPEAGLAMGMARDGLGAAPARGVK